MKLLNKILDRIGYKPFSETKKLYHAGFRKGMRAFEAASTSRLLNDWSSYDAQIDAEIKSGIVTVRARARELCRNNDYAKRFVNLCRMNIINHEIPTGFILQDDVKEFTSAFEVVHDVLASKKIEYAWNQFAKAENFSRNGRHSMRSFIDILIKALARDGEGFVQIVRNGNSKYGTQVHFIPPEYIDEKHSEVLPNGNVVVMGVELDQWRRPVAYYLKDFSPLSEVYGTVHSVRQVKRVPADEILHIYDQEFDNQTRGISWLVQSMIRMHFLRKYELAATVNATVSASKMGFIKNDPESGPGEYKGQDEDSAGSRVMEIEPGTMEELDPGQDLAIWDPKYPDAQHEMFARSTLMGIASGLGVSYASLASDLSNANYGSNRVGMLEEREWWKLGQTLIIEKFLQPLFSIWLESALGSGAIDLPYSKIEKFNQPVFIGRRWQWIDPERDIDAKIKALSAGLETYTQYAAEQGWDRDELFKELADDLKKAAELGLTLNLERPVKIVASTTEPTNGQAGKNNGKKVAV